MIDFHCHILPDIDDGSKNMDESMELARQAVRAGVTHMVVTPHGSSENMTEILAARDEKMAQLRERLAAEKIELTLIPGMEYAADGHSDSAALDYPHCRCGNDPTDASPLLIELKANMDINFAGNVLFKAQLKGIPLILAHTERYDGFKNKANMLMDLMDKGLILQFNAQNFRRSFFSFNSIPKVMMKLIRHDPDKVIIGSDAHNPEFRPAGFGKAQERVVAELGEDVWKKISWSNAAKLLKIE